MSQVTIIEASKDTDHNQGIERAKMELLANNVSSAISSVFETGTLKVEVLSIDKSEASAPPKPLLIFTPIVKGEYPVVVFLHGFSLEPSFYTQLLTHVSTHGYIVVAPQLYNLIPPSGPTEIKYAFEVTNWLPQGLQTTLPENIHPNLLKLALVGHSRGGKTAFSLALEGAQTSLNFNALIGIDPVAGMSKERQLDPKILTNTPQSLKYGNPVMLIGTGLGDMKRNCCFPACAPDGVNHKEFYYECRPPCYYFVTKNYGHLDMLDDHPKGLIGLLSNCVCKNGDSNREPMRRCVGGLVVAFVKACFDGENKDFEAIMEDPSIAPTKLCSYQAWSNSF